MWLRLETKSEIKSFVSHPFLKENTVEKRLYQEILSARVIDKGNTLIVAPTALGKTVIAALVSAFRLQEFPEKKILFLAPTKPLALQHQKSLRKILNVEEESIVLLTGSIKAKERKELWQKARIVSATPQTIESDLLSGRIDLKDVSLLIEDEAHRAVGDYSYCWLSQKYMKQSSAPLILGLTASPGSEEEKISDVCKNLFIKNIEVKTHQDFDVKPYVHEIEMHWVKVSLPYKFLEVKALLEVYLKEQIMFLRKMGYSRFLPANYLKKSELLKLQTIVRKDMIERGKSNPALYTAVSKIAALLKVLHAHTLLETQGIHAVHDYFERMQKKAKHSGAPKALKMLLNNEDVKKAMALTEKLKEENVLHPKLEKLSQILTKQFKDFPQSKVLVFNHYRDSINNLVKYLEKFPEIKARKFVGQAMKEKDKGLTQKEQAQIIQEFRAGEYNTLICSSVGEEGLDLPSVDLVVFFEPVPSEIRTIQRAGRTGRFRKGKVIILMAKNTRDEGFYWAARAKEKRMHRALKELKDEPDLKLANQTTLLKYAPLEKRVLIYADHREQSSSVVKELEKKDGMMIKIKQLEVGDFVLTDSLVVERKTIHDFIESMLDGRLFNQLIKMASNFDQPLLLVEGNPEELFSLRNVHRNAIIGALTSIALNYRVPILFTKSPEETAEYLYITARREQLGKEKDIRLRVGRKGLTLKEQQQFIIESLPLVGPSLAKNLLKRFGSVKAIINADEKELQQTENLGPKKARQIKKVLEAKFKAED